MARDEPCDKSCGDEAEVEIVPLSGIESVKVDVLDEEHEECVKALDHLAKTRQLSALGAVLRVFVKHFEHEEDMLNEHLYDKEEIRLRTHGGASLLLDSRRSHFRDHESMIDEVNKEHASALKNKRLVSSAFVNRLFRSFEHHANVYDGHYADGMAAALA